MPAPTPPRVRATREALYDFIAGHAPDRGRAWDCGCGNGQAAVALAAHFDAVDASDPSAEQIAQALPHPRVAYAVHPAEHTAYPDASFDAVCVAQALHWFDHARFWPEARRVMKPGALFAAWGYSWMQVSPAFDAALQRRAAGAAAAAVGATERAAVGRATAASTSRSTNWRRRRSRSASTGRCWELLAYVRTWSAVRSLLARDGPAAFEAIADAAGAALGRRAGRPCAR